MRTIRTLILCLLAVIAVSAVASGSASAACLKVKETGKGHWENNTCTVVGTGVKNYVKGTLVAKVPGEPGVWCAKVEAGEPSAYEDEKCTKAKTGTGEWVKVLESDDEWEVCQEVAGEGKEPPAKFDEHKCNTQTKTLAERKWEWLPIEAGKSFAVTSSGSTFTLTAGGKTVVCEEVTDTGTVEAGGKDKATTITFEKCKTGTAGCEVENKGGTLKTVVVSEIPTQLEQVEGKLVNKFSQKTVGATKEFVTLVFSGTSCSAAGYVETKVKGDVAAEVKNEANGEVKLTFPSTPITQTPKLEAFGVTATLTGTDNETLVNGWAFRAV